MHSSIEFSREFKSSVVKVILSILLFLVLYIVLIVSSIALLLACGYAALAIISAKPGFYSLIVGFTLLVLGVMIFTFMIKFIFAGNKSINPYRIEIKEKEHPKFFALIRDVAKKAGTDFPKKVFLTHELNACVFYNSGFWSLFVPVRKNLEIGLGLINSVNVSEFKAILAHEFGHFSQKSMKLGSYVYVVNSVIYNLVYDYDRWDRVLNQWKNMGGIMSVFAGITSLLADGVRFLLRKAYGLINISYMALSREMEFQADQIAASIAGKENCIKALRRTEFCQYAFDNTLGILGAFLEDKQLSNNMFEAHKNEIKRLCDELKIETIGGLPIITDKTKEINTVKSRINIKNLWASHPLMEERVKKLKSYSFSVEEKYETAAWLLFENPEDIQVVHTKKLYQIDVGDIEDFSKLSTEEYNQIVERKNSMFEINEIYNGFYNERFLLVENIEQTSKEHRFDDFHTALSEIFNKNNKEQFEKLKYDKEDLVVLQQIANKEINIRHFEFDSIRYQRRNAKKLIKTFSEDIKKHEEHLKKLDNKALTLNFAIARHVSDENETQLKVLWKQCFQIQSNVFKHSECLNEIVAIQQYVYSKTSWDENEYLDFNRSLTDFEEKYRKTITEYRLSELEDISKTHSEKLQSFLQEKKNYNSLSEFIPESFNAFYEFMNDNYGLLNRNFLLALKKATDFQKEQYELLKVPIAETNSII